MRASSLWVQEKLRLHEEIRPDAKVLAAPAEARNAFEDEKNYLMILLRNPEEQREYMEKLSYD